MKPPEMEAPPAAGSRLATALFLLLLLAGSALRLADLERRPLHGDEAVGASLASDVSRTGSYLYESSNRHGPFQYFLGGLVMRWRGESIFWIRFPYAVFGSLLILACLGFRRALGDAGWLLACALLTFSPFFVYYSRYAVQEIEFLAATALLLSCGLLFARQGRGVWLAGGLLAASWMVTIKETFLIVWGCLAASILLGLLLGGPDFRSAAQRILQSLGRRWLAGLFGMLGGVLLVAMAYTDVFRDASGLTHLALNLAEMLRHGASTADAVELHRHPAAFYLRLLLRWEWMTCALSLIGLIVALRGRKPATLLLAMYSLLTLLVHCALAYKTPWLLMTPLLPMALLSGDGIGQILADRPARLPRRAALVAAGALPLLLLPQAIQSSFSRPADPALGFAYHHAGEEQRSLAQEIRATLARVPSYSYPRAIISLPYYWPLAWYLRDEKDVVFQHTINPMMTPEELAMVPVVVTLESADRKFLAAFTSSDTVPPLTIAGHTSHRVILVPPDYMVGLVWIRNDLATPPSQP